jgi:RimJ/RimL family protein N-acetyltransferase
MPEIFSPQESVLSDEDILSFWQMMSAPSQTRWDYEDNEAFYRKPDAEVIRFFRSKVLTRTTGLGCWAREEGQIVGMASINRYTSPSREHCGELGFGVREGYQRRGIGHQLVRAVLDVARGEGLKRIECSCFAHNEPAMGLLHKAGFREEGLRTGAIEKQGQLWDIREFGLLLGAQRGSAEEC